MGLRDGAKNTVGKVVLSVSESPKDCEVVTVANELPKRAVNKTIIRMTADSGVAQLSKSW